MNHCSSLLSSLPHSLSLSPEGLHLLPPSASPQDSKHASPREKERVSVANLIRGSDNGPQYCGIAKIVGRNET